MTDTTASDLDEARHHARIAIKRAILRSDPLALAWCTRYLERLERLGRHRDA